MGAQVEYLRRWYEHMAWADDLAINALRNAGRVPPQALEIMAHILGTAHVWLTRLQGRPRTVAVWPNLSVEECAALAGELRDAYRRFLDEVDSGALERSVHYRNSAGDEFDSTIGDILVHVFMHGSYHRGQVALLVRAAGEEPAPTDYIAFVRGAPAATRQTSR
jgi:uncharacterized damage-inducible protein DinB